MSRSIALAGMMGAGKSTVGRALAAALGRGFADTDAEVERATRSTIVELFATHGEAGFRLAESRVVSELGRHDDLVIALGGGAVLSDDNVSDLMLTGVIVVLDAPLEVLRGRVAAGPGTRPLLTGSEADDRLATTLARRRPRYLEVADVVVDAARPVDVVVRDVLDWALEQGDVLTPSEHEQVMP